MGRSEPVCEGVWDGMGRSESVCEGVWGGYVESDRVCVWAKSSHVLQSHLIQRCLASDSANGLLVAAVVEPAGNVGIG